MSSLRTWAAWSALAVVLLVSPALVLLAVIAAEALTDLALEVPAVLDLVAAGALGWALFRRMSARWEGAGRSRSEGLDCAPPVAARPG